MSLSMRPPSPWTASAHRTFPRRLSSHHRFARTAAVVLHGQISYHVVGDGKLSKAMHSVLNSKPIKVLTWPCWEGERWRPWDDTFPPPGVRRKRAMIFSCHGNGRVGATGCHSSLPLRPSPASTTCDKTRMADSRRCYAFSTPSSFSLPCI